METLKRINVALIDTSLMPQRNAAMRPSKAAVDLADSTGLIEPVVVRRAGNPAFPRFELLSGLDSLAIVDALMWPSVPAVVLESCSTEDARAFVRAHSSSVAVDAATESRLSPVELMSLVQAIEQTKAARDEAERKKAEALLDQPGKRRRRRLDTGGVPAKKTKLRYPKAKYRDLALQRGLSPQLVSHLRGISRRLCDRSMDDYLSGRISLGHAKALSSFPKREQQKIATRIISRCVSVREVEESARKRRLGVQDTLSEGLTERDPNVVRVERRLNEKWGWPTQVGFDKKTGVTFVTMRFDLLSGFDHLTELLGVDREEDGTD